MSKAINEDIESTLAKLICLLEYSTLEQADHVRQVIIEAKDLWDGKDTSEVEEA
jgi:hypothetical protein